MSQATILLNQYLTSDFRKLTLDCPEVSRRAQPGQFVMLRVSSTSDPLLRRPFGIHRRLDSRRVEILYQIVGRGTQLLGAMQPETALDILGPLGRGFSMPEGGGHHILVAGGVGVAPLLFLAEELLARKGTVEVFIGACATTHLVSVENFESLGINPRISTEDGSTGAKGLITQSLEDHLARSPKPEARIYACGPRGMLAAVAGIARRHSLACEVSLDAVMACGMGACLGCVVKGAAQNASRTEPVYKKVCQEGPVFKAEDIQWGS